VIEEVRWCEGGFGVSGDDGEVSLAAEAIDEAMTSVTYWGSVHGCIICR